MKSVGFAVFIICISIMASAQTDTSETEQYGRIGTTARLLSFRVTIDIDYGERRSI